MAFIGRQLADGVYTGFLSKIDEFLAYMTDQPLPEDLRANYDRITQSALTAVSHLISTGKQNVTSVKFARGVEKVTSRVLQGVGSATRKFFTGTHTTHVAKKKSFKGNRQSNKLKSSSSTQSSSSSGLSAFMQAAQGVLSDIGTTAQKEIKKQLLSFCSKWIIEGVDVAMDSFKSGDPDYKKLKTVIDTAKERMIAACEEGNVQQMVCSLKQMTQAVEDTPIYFNGIPLLRTNQVEDTAIIKGLTNGKLLKELAHKHTHQSREQPSTIHQELSRLAKNISIQNTVHFIYSSILGLPTPSIEELYENPRLDLFAIKLRKLINASPVSGYKKFFAHISITFVSHFFYYILEYAFEQLEKKITHFIGNSSNQTLNFSNMASLFSKLNAAHVSIKDTRDFYGTIDELVSKNMELQQRQSSTKLYEHVQTKFLNEFSLKLPITKIFWQKIWSIQMGHILLNLLVMPLKLITSISMWVLLIIPELILNLILSQTLKISFFWKKTLPTLILKSLTSFSDYTRSIHPINVMMVDHLQKIWDTLKVNYIDHDENPNQSDKLPPVTKQSLELTLRHLFELLEKTPFETPEQLANFLQGHSPLEKTKIVASRFFLAQNLSAFTNIIAQAAKATISPDAKRSMIIQALSSINQGFSKKQNLTIKHMSETEEKINILLSQILSLTIRKTIERRYNFTPRNQADITDRFLKDLKSKTVDVVTIILPTLKTLPIEGSLTSLATKLEEYCRFVQNKQLEIRSNPELSKNPRALINRRFCEPIQNSLEHITKSIQELSFLQRVDTETNLVKTIIHNLATSKTLDLAMILKLRQEAFLINQSLDPLHPLIPQLGKIILKTGSFILYSEIKSKLENFAHLTETSKILESFDTLLESLESLPSLKAELSVFKHTLNSLSLAQMRVKITQLTQEFGTKIEISSVEISQHALDIEEFDPDYKTLIKKDLLKESWTKSISKVESLINELAAQVRDFQPIEHYNIKLISTTDALELMQNFAYGCLIGPMEQLLKLIRKPYIWQYGIVNQLCNEFLD